MKTETGGSAFPQGDTYGDENGMTLRDWFAGQVDIRAYSPAATFAEKSGAQPTVDELAAYIAQIRYIEADAMLKERSK